MFHPRFSLAYAVLLAACTVAPASEWTHWRGPMQNGESFEKDLPEKWSPAEAGKNNLIWKAPYGCRSTPLVHKGRVVFLSTVGEGLTEQERAVCLDEKTGKLLWEHRFNIFHTSIVSNRLGFTNPAIDPETGNIYIHGTGGELFCFSPEGKIVWKRSLTEEFGRVSGYGGRLTTPIVEEDLVIIGMVNNSWGDQGRGGHRFVAMDKKTSEIVWWSEPAPVVRWTYYSCPVIAVIKGEKILVTGSPDGSIYGLRFRTGEKVWGYQFGQSINSSPVVSGDYVYAAHAEENEDTNEQGRLICLDAGKVVKGKPSLVWEKIGLRAGFSSPAISQGRLYICDDAAKIYAFDAKTGEQYWKFAYGRLSRGSPVVADGKIYVADVNAKFHILKAGDKKCTELQETFFRNNVGPGFIECNCTPSVVNGRIFWASRDDMYCIGKPDHNTEAVVPTKPVENPAAGPVARIQIVPADVFIKPGDTVKYSVRSYDATGHRLADVTATYSLPIPPLPKGATNAPPALKGTITEAGVLTAVPAIGQQAYVEAKYENFTSRARVRVAPLLPIAVNLAPIPLGAMPGGWINTAAKYAVVEMPDKTKAIKKLAADGRPPFARANAYMTFPTSTDYTIQADLMGKEVRGAMPDAGIINSRYYLLLDGVPSSDRDELDVSAGGQSGEDTTPPTTDKPNTGEKKVRRLRILSWEGPRRVYKGTAFDWKPDTWYTLKLTVETKDGKGYIRGKAWPVGEAEPATWSVEFEDPLPNVEGAPGLFGSTKNIIDTEKEKVAGTEAFYRNIKVVPNKVK